MSSNSTTKALLVIGAGAIALYLLTRSSQQTTTTPSRSTTGVPTTIFNECTCTVTLTYTDNTGNQQTITITGGGQAEISISTANQQVTYQDCNGKSYTTTISPGAVNIVQCSYAPPNEVTVEIWNSVNAPFYVGYVENGQAKVIQIPPNPNEYGYQIVNLTVDKGSLLQVETLDGNVVSNATMNYNVNIVKIVEVNGQYQIQVSGS